MTKGWDFSKFDINAVRDNDSGQIDIEFDDGINWFWVTLSETGVHVSRSDADSDANWVDAQAPWTKE